MGSELITANSNKLLITLRCINRLVWIGVLVPFILLIKDVDASNITAIVVACVAFFAAALIFADILRILLKLRHRIIYFENGIRYRNQDYLFSELGSLSWYKTSFTFMLLFAFPYSTLSTGNKKVTVSELDFKDARYLFYKSYQSE